MALMSIHLTSDKTLEEINVESYFCDSKTRDWISAEIHDIISCDEDRLKELLDTPDTLYHVYFRLDCYETGCWEYREWETDITYFQVIPVIYNYELFIQEEEFEEKQQKLSEMDEQVRDDDGWYYHEVNKPCLTKKDLKKLAGYLAEKDIKLAHKVHGAYSSKELLGDLFNEKVYEIEKLRQKFKNWLKQTQSIKITFNDLGYFVSNQKDYRFPQNKTIFISYEEIENMDDEVILKLKPEELLSHFYDSKAIIEEFEKLKYKLT
jgi:hypothetical protein